MHPTISAPFLKIPYKLLEIHQKDADTLLQSVGLNKQELLDVRKRVPYKTVYSLWVKATELISDPCFGLKAADICHPTDLNALGYAWLSSSTLRTAFERFYRFQAMISEFVQVSLTESNDQFTVNVNVKDVNMVTMAQIDAGLAILLRMCRINYGMDLYPSAVCFAHEKPDCYQQYINYFGPKIQFSQPTNQLSFPIEVVDQPLLNSAPNLAFIADKIIIDYLESMQEENIAAKVKQAIVKQLPSEISVTKIADTLNMTPRTLHRHLKEHNTSFKDILDNVRFELSKQYIKHNRYNLTEIAFQLGFSDSSSFSRAFKHWSGQTPSNYKKL